MQSGKRGSNRYDNANAMRYIIQYTLVTAHHGQKPVQDCVMAFGNTIFRNDGPDETIVVSWTRNEYQKVLFDWRSVGKFTNELLESAEDCTNGIWGYYSGEEDGFSKITDFRIIIQ